MPETKSRRRRLDTLRWNDLSEPHPGLWLDRYVAIHDKKNFTPEEQRNPPEIKSIALEHLSNFQVQANGFYGKALARWILSFLSPRTGLSAALVKANSRVVLDLGAESVLETAIRLQRPYGMPMLPGSALKGLLSHYVKHRLGGWRKEWGDHSRADITSVKIDDKEIPIPVDAQINRSWLPSPEHWWKAEEETKPQGVITLEEAIERRIVDPKDPETDYDRLFGSVNSAGGIIFHDAWYVPENTPKSPFLQDVMTVHHPDYYRSGTVPPADYDNPTPVSYLTVRPGACFLVIIEGAHSWSCLALKLLIEALNEDGIGAKTSSGYGRMEMIGIQELSLPDGLKGNLDSLINPEKEAAVAMKQQLECAWNEMFFSGKDPTFQSHYNRIAALQPGPEKKLWAATFLKMKGSQLKKDWAKKPQKASQIENLKSWAESQD